MVNNNPVNRDCYFLEGGSCLWGTSKTLKLPRLAIPVSVGSVLRGLSGGPVAAFET